MVRNSVIYAVLLLGTLFVCFPQIAPAFRRLDTNIFSLSTEVVPFDGSKARKVLYDILYKREVHQFNDLVRQMSIANLNDVLSMACKLVEEDQLDALREHRLETFARKGFQHMMNNGLAPPPCVIQMYILLMTRGKVYVTRQRARLYLPRLRSTSQTAEGFLNKWEAEEQNAVKLLDDAANGRLTKDNKARTLARRFYDSGVEVQQGPPEPTRTLTLRREPMTDLECAQTCVYATASAYATVLANASQELFANTLPAHLFLGCRAYALLDNKRCLLFGEVPSSNVIMFSGSGRIRMYPIPAAQQFCLDAKAKGNTVNDTEMTAACQNYLTEQYSSAGAQQVSKLQNPTVLKHVCRTECTSLVQAVKTVDIGFSRGLEQSWCSADVVQMVQSHELSCCADACGWNPRKRTCEGIRLLSKLQQEEWFAECCSPSVVLQGSDRDHMCQSSSTVIWPMGGSPKTQPQRGSLEAFQFGEDIRPTFEGGAKKSKQALVEVEVEAFRDGRPSDIFDSTPCALQCADPTFMKNALLQCSRSTPTVGWVALATGVQSCPPASFIKSEKTRSPADCAELGLSSNATHASWQYLPGDRDDDNPHLGLCSLYNRCKRQDKNMFENPKSHMTNDTEVLWSRL